MAEDGDPGRRVGELIFRALARRSESRLRRLAPRPFGFLPGTPQPTPAMIGAENEAVSMGALTRAILTRTPIPLSSMSLTYGNQEDLAAMFTEITTDFTPDHQDSSPLEYMLGEADSNDAAIARGDMGFRPLQDDPAGPFSHGTADIIVAGERRTVATLTYRRQHGFRFQQGQHLVTVVSRHRLPGLPVLGPVTDLQPYIEHTAAARRPNSAGSGTARRTAQDCLTDQRAGPGARGAVAGQHAPGTPDRPCLQHVARRSWSSLTWRPRTRGARPLRSRS